MHILPQLRKLEHKYRDWLVVVGVHSSKFPNEKDTANVRSAVLRYGIEHPVINDRDFQLWQEYGVRAWPTLMFIDPNGKVLGKHEGEFEFAQFDQLLTEMGVEFKENSLLNEVPLAFQLEAEKAASRPLSFPGKIEADAASGRLFIADSGHNRILVSGLDGHVESIIGSGEPGNVDGTFADARFNHPQGLIIDGQLVYIADAENHTIRLAELNTGSISTIAGTGEQSLFRHKGGAATEFPLNSPYDLVLRNKTLYIAMAGFHQLWSMNLESNTVAPYAGDGGEDITDGPRLAARLAQPYGITLEGETLYFVDSETSAIRTVPLIDAAPDIANVQTLVGTGLFDFGDRDGPYEQAVLQHAQGAVVSDGIAYLTDTYNHKIKAMDLANRTVTTIAGTGQPGGDDGPALESSFFEPAGITFLDGEIYVADTNNHAIRVLDFDTNHVSTLELTGLPE